MTKKKKKRKKRSGGKGGQHAQTDGEFRKGKRTLEKPKAAWKFQNCAKKKNTVSERKHSFEEVTGRRDPGEESELGDGTREILQTGKRK